MAFVKEKPLSSNGDEGCQVINLELRGGICCDGSKIHLFKGTVVEVGGISWVEIENDILRWLFVVRSPSLSAARAFLSEINKLERSIKYSQPSDKTIIHEYERNHRTFR